MTSPLQDIFDYEGLRVSEDGTAAVAETPEAVAEIYRFAKENGFTVKPVSRDVEPGEKEIVLLPGKGLTGELHLAPDDFYVEVPSTIRASELEAYLREREVSLHLPLVTELDDAPLGEMITEYPGNLLAPIHGEIPRLLLGVMAIRPDGDVVDFGRRTIKGVAGYNLSGFFIGSRGQGGLVVRARWRLFPVPEERGLFGFDTVPEDWEARVRMAFGVPLRYEGKRVIYLEGSPERIAAAVAGLGYDGFGIVTEIARGDDTDKIIREITEESFEAG